MLLLFVFGVVGRDKPGLVDALDGSDEELRPGRVLVVARGGVRLEVVGWWFIRPLTLVPESTASDDPVEEVLLAGVAGLTRSCLHLFTSFFARLAK